MNFSTLPPNVINYAKSKLYEEEEDGKDDLYPDEEEEFDTTDFFQNEEERPDRNMSLLGHKNFFADAGKRRDKELSKVGVDTSSSVMLLEQKTQIQKLIESVEQKLNRYEEFYAENAHVVAGILTNTYNDTDLYQVSQHDVSSLSKGAPLLYASENVADADPSREQFMEKMKAAQRYIHDEPDLKTLFRGISPDDEDLKQTIMNTTAASTASSPFKYNAPPSDGGGATNTKTTFETILGKPAADSTAIAPADADAPTSPPFQFLNTAAKGRPLLKFPQDESRHLAQARAGSVLSMENLGADDEKDSLAENDEEDEDSFEKEDKEAVRPSRLDVAEIIGEFVQSGASDQLREKIRAALNTQEIEIRPGETIEASHIALLEDNTLCDLIQTSGILREISTRAERRQLLQNFCTLASEEDNEGDDDYNLDVIDTDDDLDFFD